jgi:CDP-diacylglycerol--glycerol-3-phosphate 3-phosphatidyltransferase
MLPFLYFKFENQNQIINIPKQTEYIYSIHSFKIWFGILFILAAFTDYLDGFIARKFQQKTVFGKFFDPIADKLLVIISFFYLYILCQEKMLLINYPQMNKELKSIILSVLIINILRDFLIMGLRCIACEQKKLIITSSFLGKIKTFFTFISIILILFSQFLIDFFNIKNLVLYINFIKIFLIINIFFVIYSGLNYIIKNYKLIFNNLYNINN